MTATTIEQVEHVTHNDLDAAACDVVVRAAFGSGAVHTRFCGYDTVDEEILRVLERQRVRGCPSGSACLLIISDISPTSAACWHALDAAAAAGCMLVCADHHVTHAEEMQRRPWCTYDDQACGAQLLFNLFRARLLSPNLTTLPLFVAAVDAYDRWQLDGRYRLRGETLNRLYRFMGRKTFVEEFADPARDRRDDFRWLDSVLKTRAEQEVKRICTEQVRMELFQDSADGKYVVILGVDAPINDIAQVALSMYPALDFVVLISRGNTISLRSRVSGGIDISKVAQRLGGGGHRSAAGFSYALDEDLRRIVRGLLAREV